MRADCGRVQARDSGAQVTSRLAITVSEAARLLSVDQLTIRRLVKRGEMGCLRFGRSVRIPIDSLYRFIDGHRIPSAAQVGPEPGASVKPNRRIFENDHGR